MHNLAIPKLLLRLVQEGRWPSKNEMDTRQIPSDKVRLIAPGESLICLYAPSGFSKVSRQLRYNMEFWSECGALREIAPDLALQIGDFGPGSDAPIILDYRRNRESPCVLRLQWLSPFPNRWTLCADSFDEFVQRLGLISFEERFSRFKDLG